MFRPGVFAVVFVLSFSACSSIPSVTFEDDDGGQSDDARPMGEDASDGDGEAGDERRVDAEYSCPDNPPPNDVGICCPYSGGSRICLGCSTIEDCERCTNEGCSGTMSRGKVCCRKNPVHVVCDEAEDCL